VRLVQADGIGGRLVFRVEEEDASDTAGITRRIKRGPGRNLKRRRK
jgi:hypothetical protein